MLRRWRLWRKTPFATRVALVEATVALALARVGVRHLFKHIARWALKPGSPGTAVPPAHVQWLVKHSLRVAGKNIPWTSICLPNAIAAKLMLARRGYESTIHLGVGFKEASLTAHAWLDAGGKVLTGEEGREGLAPILN